MVWSGGFTTIRLPFDAVPGGGRNWVDIGEEIPPEVADKFSAALIFRSGAFDATTPDAMFPNGFAYWVVGIALGGSFEIVAVYYTVSAPTGGGITYFRQTVMTFSPPVGVDNPPVVSIGDVAGYGSYHESGVQVRTQQLTDVVPKTYFNSLSGTGGYPNPGLFNDWAANPAPNDNPNFRVDAAGNVILDGLIRLNTAGSWGFSEASAWLLLPPGCRPLRSKQFVLLASQSTYALMALQVMPNGNVYHIGNPNNPSWTYVAGAWVSLDGIRFKAEQ